MHAKRGKLAMSAMIFEISYIFVIFFIYKLPIFEVKNLQTCLRMHVFDLFNKE